MRSYIAWRYSAPNHGGDELPTASMHNGNAQLPPSSAAGNISGDGYAQPPPYAPAAMPQAQDQGLPQPPPFRY